MYNLGVYYESGRGVKKDISKAKYWYQKSCEKRYQRACEALKNL